MCIIGIDILRNIRLVSSYFDLFRFYHIHIFTSYIVYGVRSFRMVEFCATGTLVCICTPVDVGLRSAGSYVSKAT